MELAEWLQLYKHTQENKEPDDRFPLRDGKPFLPLSVADEGADVSVFEWDDGWIAWTKDEGILPDDWQDYIPDLTDLPKLTPKPFTSAQEARRYAVEHGEVLYLEGDAGPCRKQVIDVRLSWPVSILSFNGCWVDYTDCGPIPVGWPEAYEGDEE